MKGDARAWGSEGSEAEVCAPFSSIHSLITPLEGREEERDISPGAASGKEPTCQCRSCKKPRFDPWVGKIPWRRKWQPTPASLPGESHGRRSLVGYSAWGHQGSDITEATQHACCPKPAPVQTTSRPEVGVGIVPILESNKPRL